MLANEILSEFRDLCDRREWNDELNQVSKKVSSVLKECSSQENFELMIAELDPKLNLLHSTHSDNVSCSFIKSGGGAGGIHPLRKIEHTEDDKKTSLIEKLFVKASGALERQKMALDFIDNKSNLAPAIRDIRSGEYLDAVYFDYIDGISGRKNIKSNLDTVISSILCLNLENTPITTDKLPYQGLEFHADFQNRVEPVFACAGDEVKGIVIEKDFFERGMQICNSSPLVFSHGNPNSGNLIISENKVRFIDWDSWGLYPIGFDIAWFIFANDISKSASLLDYSERSLRNELDRRKRSSKDIDAIEFNVKFLSFIIDISEIIKAPSLSDVFGQKELRLRQEALTNAIYEQTRYKTPPLTETGT